MSRPALLLASGLAALVGCATLDLGGPVGERAEGGPAPPLRQVWERAVGAAFGPAGPTVTDRYVVVGTRRGELVVLDRETGDPRGAVSLGRSVEGQVAVSADGTTLYVPTAEEKGGVVAYDVARGAPRWRWRGGPVQGGVMATGDRVVASTLAGATVGLDAATGEEVWTRASAPGAQVHAAPAAVGPDVVVADDRGTVVRLDRQSGAVRWTAEVGGPVYAAPAVDGADVVVTTTRGRVARLDAATGAVVWAVDADATVRATSAALTSGAVIVGFSDGTLRALDRPTGAERWRHASSAAVSARPVAFGAHVAVGSLDRRLAVVEAETGREVWSAELRGRTKSALAVGGGRLYVLTEPGHVVAFESAAAPAAPTTPRPRP